MGSHGAKSFGKSVHLILSTTLCNRVYYPRFTDEIIEALNHSPQSMWLVNGGAEIWTQDLLAPESVLLANVEEPPPWRAVCKDGSLAPLPGKLGHGRRNLCVIWLWGIQDGSCGDAPCSYSQDPAEREMGNTRAMRLVIRELVLWVSHFL